MYPQQYTQPPLNSLPPEVLGKIFLYSLELPGKRLKLPHPRTLCSVCSRWRHVGLSTPRLWTAVVVTILHGISGQRAEEKISYLHTWIGRSGVLPLTLYLRRGKWDPSEHDRTVLFLVALARHASRWEAVYFDFAAELPGRRHSPEFYIDFPFASWSSLRRISSSKHFAPLHQNKSIPWSQLTHFTIEADMSPQVALEILERCPHLVDARIRLDSTLTQAKTSSPLIQNNLRKLDLMTYNLALFFSAITLPSLADLRLILLSPSSEEANHFVSFLTRSRCQLDKLAFSGIPFSADDMTHCLEQESCNSLTELTIEYTMITQPRPHRIPAVTDDVLKRLTLRSSKPAPLCPNLLYLRFHKGEWDSLDTIVDMVSSRLCPEEIPGLDAPRIRHLHVEVLFHHQLEQLLGQVGEKSGMNYASDGDGAFFTFIASREAIVGKVGPTYAHGSFFLM
ncbi:hypothetical protein F5887DRAFT_1013060 [Amanita rubescens]|nr:hypothetical protein F5887DRAFT_1013060 [Amanita rubescens]